MTTTITATERHIDGRVRCADCNGGVFTYAKVLNADGSIAEFLCSPCAAHRRGAHICNCGRPVHYDWLGRLIHSNGRTYNHPATIARRAETEN
jgi:hypothetical protein